MSMTWQFMESLPKSRAGRLARSGIGSPARSIRAATREGWGRAEGWGGRAARLRVHHGCEPTRRAGERQGDGETILPGEHGPTRGASLLARDRRRRAALAWKPAGPPPPPRAVGGRRPRERARDGGV